MNYNVLKMYTVIHCMRNTYKFEETNLNLLTFLWWDDNTSSV